MTLVGWIMMLSTSIGIAGLYAWCIAKVLLGAKSAGKKHNLDKLARY